jgi:hypothetical protein
MVEVLDDLEKARSIQEQFFAILGPELMKVTGNATRIEDEKQKVVTQVQKLINFNKDIFNENQRLAWKECFRRFNESIISIDNAVKTLIEETFSDTLTSSEGAFDLLSNFQNVDTRAVIKETLDKKYDEVLNTYEKELDQYRILFENNKKNPPISKNMPEKAGQIAWARSLMGRIKAPIDKFKQKSDKLNPMKFMKVATQYVKLAKDLD